MNDASGAFCYLHLGPSPPPEHLLDSIWQTQAWNPDVPIFVVLEKAALSAFEAKLAETWIRRTNLQLIAAADLPATAHHETFRTRHRLDEQFRDGFWRYTSERFFVLEELMGAFRLTNVVHLESDVMPYFSLNRLMPIFQRHGPLAWTRDAQDRVVPGIVFVRETQGMRTCNEFLAAHVDRHWNDMSALAQFQNAHPDLAASLPIIMPAYDTGLSSEYSRGVSDFGGIFDAAALGQFLDGVDPRNVPAGEDPDITIGFRNETCVFDCGRLEFSWKADDDTELRKPICRLRDQAGEWTPIHSLHVHSKRLFRFASRLPITPEDIITGERLQALADVALVPRAIAEFHPNVERYATTTLIFPDYGHITAEHLAHISRQRVLFVYPHALEGFLRTVWPRLTGKDYVLITHNSDAEIDARFLPLLEDAKLARWFAQNAAIAHPKLTPLPIGIANRQWPHGNLNVLYDRIARHAKYRKTRLLHVAFHPHTHPERLALAQQWYPRYPGLAAAKPFVEYLDDLAQHRFSLCPCGNGLDTHRFWECLYLGVVPVVKRSVHAETWQKTLALPMVMVDDWSEVTENSLRELAQRLPEAPPLPLALTVEHYRRLIRSA